MAESKFLESCKTGKLQKAKAAIASDIDVNCNGGKQHENKTALILASENGHAAIVSLLLENDANVDGVDKYGMTSLHHAAFKGHNEICKILINNGADIDCYDKASLTPLHEAASSGKGGVIKVLLKAGASVVLTDKNNKTALDIATEFNRTTCIKYLKKGVDKHNRKMAKVRFKNEDVKHSEHAHDQHPIHPKKQKQRAETLINLNVSKKNSKVKKTKHKQKTETDKMKAAITQLNLFGEEHESNNALIDQLKEQNQALKFRIKKLQKDKENLKQKLADSSQHKAIAELKEDVEALNATIKDVEEDNDDKEKEIASKDREISKLNQVLLQRKHKFETEKKDIKKQYQDKIKQIEQKYATKIVNTDSDKDKEQKEDMNDGDINDVIDECGDDVQSLKDKLYQVMEIMKNMDEENEELKAEIESLTKKYNKKVDKLMSDYGAVREELSEKGGKLDAVDGGGTSKHQRKSSKILRKNERFQIWMESDVALPQYIQHFHENGYDRIDVVKTLNESDLKKIGISKIGHRRLIMEKIHELINKQHAVNSRSVSSSPPPPIDENDEDEDQDDDEEEEEEEEEDNEDENSDDD
eukprot:164737_1